MKKLLLIIFCLQSYYGFTQNYSWVNNCKEIYSNETVCVAVDQNGNSFMAGTFLSPTMVIGSYTLTNASVMGSTNNSDLFLAKYDGNGNVLWAKAVNGNAYEKATDILVDNGGNLYLTGAFSSSVITSGTVTLTKTGNYDSDILLLKFDPNGNTIWARKASSSNNEQGNSIALNSNNQVYVLGNYYSNVTASSNTLSISNGNIYVLGYDANGNLISSYTFGTANVSSQPAKDIYIDANNDFIITGGFSNATVTFGSTTLSNPNSSSNNYSMYLFKANSTGTIQWAKSFNTYGKGKGNNAYAVCADVSNNIYLTGNYWGDIGVGGITADTYTLTNNTGGTKLFLSKFDPSGNVLWAESNKDIVANIQLAPTSICSSTSSGDVFISGNFNGNKLCFNTYTINATSYAGFVIKYNSSGNTTFGIAPTQTNSVGGHNSNDIAVDAQNNLYNAGYFETNNLQFNSTVITNNPSYLVNAFITKLSPTTTGLTAIEGDAQKRIYPNPCQDKFIMYTESETAITITNILGETILTQQLQKGNNEVNLGNQSIGIYFIKNNNSTFKIIKQ